MFLPEKRKKRKRRRRSGLERKNLFPLFRGGRSAGMEKRKRRDANTIRESGKMRSSFVDLQVNGFLGIDFSRTDLTVGKVLSVADELEKRGTGAFLATVITSSMEIYRHVLPVLAEASEEPALRGRLLGIHLEGPFISPEPGALGAHPLQAVREPSPALFDELYGLARGKVRLLTVAPERPGAETLIAHARETGVTVSVGHSLAEDEDVARAIAVGATLSTHLGNGIPNLLNRHGNPVYAQLASSLRPMLISDGHHVPRSFLKIVLGLKGISRTVITSDSAPVAGLPEGEYEIFGTRVRVCPDGAIRNLNAPTLAGSSAVMLDCLNFLAGLFPSFSEEDFWRLGRDNPLEAVGMSSIAVSLPRNVGFENGRFLAAGCLKAG